MCKRPLSTNHIPLYAAGGINISKEVVAALNHNLKHQPDH